MFELILIPALLGLGLAMDYLASDNDDDAPPVEVTLDDTQSSFDGTDARDHVTGNALDNLIMGAGGNDLLAGLDGHDTLQGGMGEDRLFAGAGNDIAMGGPGDDRMFLQDGHDTTDMTEDAGDDFIRGGAGNDTLTDASGHNQIFGDLHHDLINTVDGLAPDGSIDPAESGTADTVDGGFGDDTLVGDAGDQLTGGEGEDRFVIAIPAEGPDAPAVVTDFDLRDDLFSVVFLQTTPANDDVTFVFDPANSVVKAQLDGQEVATLQGLAATDIPFINTFVTTLPELMAATG